MDDHVNGAIVRDLTCSQSKGKQIERRTALYGAIEGQ